MRIVNWNPNKFDETFEDIAIDRLVAAAEVVAKKARDLFPETKGISRPKYKTGKYAGLPWTSRDAGRLKKSIRVVRKKTKSGKAFSRKRNVRVYAGHYKAYYPVWVESGSSTAKRKVNRKGKQKISAKNVEFGSGRIPARPFMRPAFYGSIDEIKSIVGAK